MLDVPSMASSAVPYDTGCGGRRFRGERDIDDEDAALAGHVADPDLAVVRPNGAAGDRQPQPQARAVAAAAVAKCLEQIVLAGRDAAALVLGFDQQPVALAAHPQSDDIPLHHC